MSNPLGLGATATISRAPFDGMAQGEVRTAILPGKKPTREGEVTIERTSRPFVFDWVDASNAALITPDKLRWVVDENGRPKLVQIGQWGKRRPPFKSTK